MNYLDLEIEKIKNILNSNILTNDKRESRKIILSEILNESIEPSNYKDIGGVRYFSSKFGMGLLGNKPIIYDPCLYTGSNPLYDKMIYVYDSFEKMECFPFAIEHELVHIRRHNNIIFKFKPLRRIRFISIYKEKEADLFGMNECIKKYGIDKTMKYMENFISAFNITREDIIRANEYRGFLYNKIYEKDEINKIHRSHFTSEFLDYCIEYNLERINLIKRVLRKLKKEIYKIK